MRNIKTAFALVLAGWFANGFVFAQALSQSPEVHPDRQVTFRLRAPQAKAVTVEGIGSHEMTRDEKGVWSVTIGPLDPEIYSYTFKVDGTTMIDPINRNIKKWFSLNSQVEVPGDPPLLHEKQTVPHGSIHQHFYDSKAVGHSRPVYIYTPPGYDPRDSRAYPVVYLLHGFGDDESAWTEVGRAHLIADNLISQNRIQPPIIVMPNGHPLPVKQGERFQDYAPQNHKMLEKDLTGDLIPFVEKHYRVKTKARDRAIVGLSMGGGHSLGIGLSRLDYFAWVGGFSSAAPSQNLEESFAGLIQDSKSSQRELLQLLWIGCGKQDFLLDRNEAFVTWLKDQKVPHTYRLSEGGHEWPVWRKYLAEFLPQLF